MAKPLRLPNVTEQVVLDGLSVRLIAPAEADRWNALVTERHYLKNAQLVGEQLRYVGEYQGQWLLLLGWSAPAWHLKARDAWLHWSVEQRATRRHFLAQNSRCLVLVDRRASRPAQAALGARSGSGGHRRAGPARSGRRGAARRCLTPPHGVAACGARAPARRLGHGAILLESFLDTPCAAAVKDRG
jgi:hypothetical protein